MITTAEKIAVMWAFGAGKKIELTPRHYMAPWALNDHPLWNWEDWNYRVKPEPVEKWVVIDRDGDVDSAWDSKPAANDHAAFMKNNVGNYAPYRVVKMREIIE